MKENNHLKLVPGNFKGKEITATASEQFDDRKAANALFAIARQRLLSVNDWQKTAGSLGAAFQLTDAEGTEVFRNAEKGDHIRIDIPGPGSQAGEGYDWVRIEDIAATSAGDTDAVALVVRPASNPLSNNTNIAHFYAEQSTSTFIVAREHNKLTASVYDRNIEANEETKQPLDKIRNALVGLGAKHGFSKLQWQALATGLIKR